MSSHLSCRVSRRIPSAFAIACAALLLGSGAEPQGSVKDEQKISATVGGFPGDLDPFDTFGIDLESLGDLDGDGTSDLAVGVRQDDDGGTDQGAVWILFLDPDGTVADAQKISELEGGFGGALDPSDLFGRAVACLGDVDGDGIQDLAVGAPGDDDGGSFQGAVWILFLNSDGTVRDEQKISEAAGGFGGALDALDSFGVAVAGLGDLDGDGVVDLAASTHRDDDGGTDFGAVWILLLNSDGTVRDEQKISQTAGGFAGTLHAFDQFGASLGSLGDLDGDGTMDLVVGAFADDDGGTDQGAVWILFLDADGTVRDEQKISEVSGGFGGAFDPSDFFGHGVASIGDLDGDGVLDVAVGALVDDDGGIDQGALWLLFLNSNGTVKEERKISATSGGFAGDLDPGDRLGVSVTSVGDVDGDGTTDLAVGADFDDDGGTDQGALWILFLDWTCLLAFPADEGFDGTSGVYPSAGVPGQSFEFRVDYFDDDGLLPEAGTPKLRLDLNADGDWLDAGEGEFVMLAADADADVIDGKTYFYALELAYPGAGSYRYSFQARNSLGEDAVGAPTAWRSGPDVRDDLYDLALFADDILFSNPAPAVGETFTVTVRFDNESELPVDDVSIRVEYDGDVLHASTFPHLDPHATGEIHFPWAFAQDGFYALRAYVDHDDDFEEANELDNDATRPIVVGEYTLPGSIELLGLPSETTFTAGGYVGFSGTARYLGTPLDPPPAVRGGTLTFRPSWGATQVAYTDAAGAFSLAFPGPTTAGTYLVEVEATDYTLTSTYEVVLDTLPPPSGPNLRVSVARDVSEPCVGDTVTLSWSVTNTGNVTSPASRATLESPGSGLLADVVVPMLAPGQTHVPASVPVLASVEGTRSFTARVDPDAAIAELTELDNAASASFQAYPTCFEWDPDHVRFSPAPHCAGAPITMSFFVRNSGCFDAPSTSARFRVGGTAIADQAFAPLAGKGEGRWVSFVHTFGTPGSYTVSFQLDPDGAAAECDDANDLISATLQVAACPAGAVDYRLDACALSASDDEPALGQAIHFRATVTNAGTLPGSAPLAVRFLLDGAPLGGDVFTSGALAAGASELVQSAVPWTVDFLPHRLEVVLDPGDAESESSEVNNLAARVLPYELAPVPIPTCPGSGASLFSTCAPCVNDPVWLLGVVINAGLFSVPVGELVDVAFEDGFGGSALVLGSATVTNLRARGECSPASLDSASIQALFAAPGTHPITFRVDPDDDWPEYVETNNSLTRNLAVSSCVPLPDLYIRSEHINPEELNLAPGEMLDWVTLTVFNEGLGAASDVTLDLDVDGQPLCADLALGTIAAGASSSIQCTMPWIAPAGTPAVHVLQARIDPAPGETSLADNSATRAVIVGPAPDLYVAAEYIVPFASGSFGFFGAWIRVANAGLAAGSAELAVSVLDASGQATLVDRFPVTLPAGTAGGPDPETWILATWQANARRQDVRAALTGVTPLGFDDSNDSAERTLDSNPRVGKRRP